MINNMIGIISCSLALFVSEYLRTNRSDLAPEEIDTPKELEQSILSGSTIRSDGSIDKRAGIRLKTARKWLNCLVYKWKKVQKGVFFDGHKWEDVVEYRETFLSKLKLLLPYFMGFSDNSSILPKAYPDNCIVGGSDQRPIIMITHDKNTFSANNSRQKV